MSDEDEIITVVEMLKYRADEERDRKIFNFYDRHGFVSLLTSEEIYNLAGKFAFLVKSWGFQKGDVIANGLPNSPERVISDFGVIMAGCVLANCQVIEKDGSDFWHTARISHCSGVIISARQHDPANQIFSKFLLEQNTTTTNSKTNRVYDVTIPQAPTIRKVIVCDRKLLTKTPKDAEEEKLEEKDKPNCFFLENMRTSHDDVDVFQADCDPSDLTILLGTSGSSGFNKLVASTQKDILDKGRLYGKDGRNYLFLNDRPFGWLGGFPFDFLGSGACRVIQDMFEGQETQTASELWHLVSATKCQVLALMPYDLHRLIDEFEHNPPEYKAFFISTGGQPCKKELFKAVGLLCGAMAVCYGSSEAGGAVTFGFITEDKKTLFDDFYCGTVMKDDMQIKIVDEEGKDLELGEVGEILLKCDRLVKEYYNLEVDSSTQKTQLYTDDGWFKTNDRGKLVEDGRLYCYGRQGDVTSLNGTIIYLSWPESILSKCPQIQNSNIIAIEDVYQAGDVVFCACVVPKSDANLTEETVKEFFDTQLVDTEYKDKLKLSHVLFMDTLPLIPTGKVNKRALKQLVKEKLNFS